MFTEILVDISIMIYLVVSAFAIHAKHIHFPCILQLISIMNKSRSGHEAYQTVRQPTTFIKKENK